MFKLSIIGTGYVGLVTGTCFAEMGNHVICVDIDNKKIEKLQVGKLTIYEPDLEGIFQRNLSEKRLTFTTDIKKAILESDIIFLALPTPPGEDGSADLSYVINASSSIAEILRENGKQQYKIIVNKSTVPVGTADKVRAEFTKKGLIPSKDFDVVSNPEFLREGLAVNDFLKPDRIVIGSSSSQAQKIMGNLYQPFIQNGSLIVTMDERSAEMTKYAANTFLATKITFMNEIANLCERTGANVDMVRHGIGLDPRIGTQFLYAGIGFGGSCFPKDVKALAHIAHEQEYDFKILSAVLSANAYQKVKMVDMIENHFSGNLAEKKIAVWGLAFKPSTDDVREAPAHEIITALLERGAVVSAFDPEAIETSKAVLKDSIIYSKDAYEAISGADALVICTEWFEFRAPDFEKMKTLLVNNVIFDGRNMYDLQQMRESGFTYYSIGRPYIKADK